MIPGCRGVTKLGQLVGRHSPKYEDEMWSKEEQSPQPITKWLNRECSLSPLENRRSLATIKFTNILRSNNMDHISARVFNEWKGSNQTKKIFNSTA
ncbi:hypothetical protein CEXT_253231 [Caerostris extrusa]|uniref:Uncharacterized protein n=1 Tax=Caerostris extrusa TaxID=172846 RepID=A0AAV4TC01_CAEEX|nr:hypothetical protein CEXT_253231 [Caerostris extrusa]